MQKIILLTGATDGIGLETAKMLVSQGHHVILHGRNGEKLQAVHDALSALPGAGSIETIQADLSSMVAVDQMIAELAQRFGKLDVLINNAGVYAVPETISPDGLDMRFAVNTYAPYLLTSALLPLFDATGRIVNLSSAAQAPVDLAALQGERALSDGEAYAQSKLALTMWSRALGLAQQGKGPMIVSVNPKSFLGSKMVKEAYGVAGGDITQGADILVRAALSDEFAQAHGQYFDNDIEAFAPPHRDALDDHKVQQVIDTLDSVLAKTAKLA